MRILPVLAAVLLSGAAAPAIADKRGKSSTIVEAAIASPDHKTLVAALKAAKLVDTLSGPGPFTVFAPTDAAFAALPAGTIASLLEPANIGKLQAVLAYHVVSGQVKAADVIKAIEAGKGTAKLTTVEGSTLTANLVNGSVVLTDENGGAATVVATDLEGSNGVIHVTNAVSLPK
ncbi:MAG: fasciclin domain-containing protein [Alphaproteobacteria bacterium]|nr:fasciclin domain-containing protein [Alphaproteobacteria bacterium]